MSFYYNAAGKRFLIPELPCEPLDVNDPEYIPDEPDDEITADDLDNFGWVFGERRHSC